MINSETAETPIPDVVRFCPTCNKPFTAATSYTRHVAYCRRTQLRPRRRQRSCRACKASKARCSFQSSCSRCVAKGVKCIYDHTLVQTPNLAPEQHTSSSPIADSGGLDTHFLLGDECMNTTPDQGFGTLDPLDTFTDNLTVDATALIPIADSGGLDTHFLLGDECMNTTPDQGFGTLDPLDTFTDNLTVDATALIPISAVMGPSSHLDGVNLFPASWEPPFDFSSQQLTSGEDSWKDGTVYLTRVSKSTALAQRSADLIMDALYAVPEQMRRRETFPPFIHPHWHLPSLPEPLTVCMHLSQMYGLQTKEIRSFIWRTILAEQRRAVQRLLTLTSQELLAEMQAGMVYLIMRLLDGIFSDRDWTREMMTIQNMLCKRFVENNDNQFFVTEEAYPSLTWEDWIYAESRRRTSMVWFLVTKTIVVRTLRCVTTETPEVLPLPAPKMQWEARSNEAWLQELQAGSPALSTFGSLIAAKKKSHERSYAQMLGAWNAGADSLGILLNVAVAIL